MNTALKSIIDGGRLPSLPEVGLRIIQVVQQPEPDYGELVSIIRTDPAICSRILRTANSAALGMRQQFSSIEAALPVLGVRMVRTLVLGFSLASRTDSSQEFRDGFRRLWRNAITHACTAENLAERVAPRMKADWFLAGLLQDIGQLALLNHAGEEYEKLMMQDGFCCNTTASESAVFGVDHVELSVAMCESWSFEPELIESIASHHQPPSIACDGCTPDNSEETADPTSLPLALYVADMTSILLQQFEQGNSEHCEAYEKLMLESYGMQSDESHELLTDLSKRVNQIADSFGVDVGDAPPVEKILADAQNALVEIAMQSQLEELNAKSAVEETRRELDEVRTESKQIREQAEQIKQRANRDALTGVYNRGYLDEVLKDELEECREEGTAIAIIFLDIDHFKSFNDTFGHEVGDEAICVAANVLKKSTRATDLVIRYGGDEFVVLMPRAELETSREIAERIRSGMETAELSGANKPVMTASIGVVYFQHADLEKLDPPRFLKAADEAMYAAKKQGRNAVSFVLASECKELVEAN